MDNFMINLSPLLSRLAVESHALKPASREMVFHLQLHLLPPYSMLTNTNDLVSHFSLAVSMQRTRHFLGHHPHIRYKIGPGFLPLENALLKMWRHQNVA